jgi:hypothetical protein
MPLMNDILLLDDAFVFQITWITERPRLNREIKLANLAARMARLVTYLREIISILFRNCVWIIALTIDDFVLEAEKYHGQNQFNIEFCNSYPRTEMTT